MASKRARSEESGDPVDIEKPSTKVDHSSASKQLKDNAGDPRRIYIPETDKDILLVINLPTKHTKDMQVYAQEGMAILPSKPIHDNTTLVRVLADHFPGSNKMNVNFHYSLGSPGQPWTNPLVFDMFKMLQQIARSYKFAFQVTAHNDQDSKLYEDTALKRNATLTRHLYQYFCDLASENRVQVQTSNNFKNVRAK